MTQLDMTTSVNLFWKLRLLHRCHAQVDVSVFHARLSHSLLCMLDHLRCEIDSDNSTLWADLVSSQDYVYPSSATEIHNHVAWSKARETSRVTTTAREIECKLW